MPIHLAQYVVYLTCKCGCKSCVLTWAWNVGMCLSMHVWGGCIGNDGGAAIAIGCRIGNLHTQACVLRWVGSKRVRVHVQRVMRSSVGGVQVVRIGVGGIQGLVGVEGAGQRSGFSVSVTVVGEPGSGAAGPGKLVLAANCGEGIVKRPPPDVGRCVVRLGCAEVVWVSGTQSSVPPSCLPVRQEKARQMCKLGHPWAHGMAHKVFKRHVGHVPPVRVHAVFGIHALVAAVGKGRVY